MYEGSRLTSPAPWITSFCLDSGVGVGVGVTVGVAASWGFSRASLAASSVPDAPAAGELPPAPWTRSATPASAPTRPPRNQAAAPTNARVANTAPMGTVLRRACRRGMSVGGDEVAGSADILSHRVDQGLRGVEPGLVAQVRPELDGHRTAHDLAVEVQEVGLDVQGFGAEGGVRPNADRGDVRRAVDLGPPRVDASAGQEQTGPGPQVRGGEPEVVAAAGTAHHGAVEHEPAPQRDPWPLEVAPRQGIAHRRGGH